MPFSSSFETARLVTCSRVEKAAIWDMNSWLPTGLSGFWFFSWPTRSWRNSSFFRPLCSDDSLTFLASPFVAGVGPNPSTPLIGRSFRSGEYVDEDAAAEVDGLDLLRGRRGVGAVVGVAGGGAARGRARAFAAVRRGIRRFAAAGQDLDRGKFEALVGE